MRRSRDVRRQGGGARSLRAVLDRNVWSEGVRGRSDEPDRIRQALDEDRLPLYCQPIVNLANNEVTQYELLLRLEGEPATALPPSAFLSVAERFGLIQSVDFWVVRQAIALIAEHARRGRQLTLGCLG